MSDFVFFCKYPEWNCGISGPMVALSFTLGAMTVTYVINKSLTGMGTAKHR